MGRMKEQTEEFQLDWSRVVAVDDVPVKSHVPSDWPEVPRHCKTHPEEELGVTYGSYNGFPVEYLVCAKCLHPEKGLPF